MNTGRTILVLFPGAGFCVSGGVQAFCFLKGKDSKRAFNNYSYPVPVAGFARSQYPACPYTGWPASAWQGLVQPGYVPVPQGGGLSNGGLGRR
jgi:hypothetical protein